MAESDKAMWERPWTTDELRQNSEEWTLAGDAGLLNHLQKLSESLLSRTHEVQKEVDSLVRETKLTNARMGIAVNDFLMLSNTQFVENRVYDEEVQEETPTDEKKQDDQERTKEQREQQLVPRIVDALRKGLLVVNEAFESIDSTESENESELAIEASYQRLPLLQPKDYYQHRPLPHIIGSDRFMRDDTAGLGDVVSAGETNVEVAESENESEKSVAESREEKSEERTDASASEEDYPHHERTKIKSIISSSNEWSQKDDNGSDGEDLFSPDDKEVDDEIDSESEEEITIATANRNGPLDFASELAAKLNLTANPVKESDSEVKASQDSMDSKKKSATKDDITTRNSSRKTSRKNSEAATKPKVPSKVPVEPEEEAEDSPFSKKGGLFSGGGGLFDDLNEEDSDLFADVPKTRTKSKRETLEDKSSHSRARSSSKGSTAAAMFDDEADLFVARKGTKSSIKDENVPKTSSTKGLFDNDDDEEEDDDLFSKLAPRKASTRSEAKPSSRKNTVSSMLGQEDDLFKGPRKPSVEKEKVASSKESTPRKKPAGAVSMFGPGVNPLAAAIRAHRRMSESDKEEVEDNDWSDSEKTRPGSRSSKSSMSASSSKVESKIASRSNSVSSNGTSLFAEDVDSNDLFTSSAEKDTKPKPNPVGGVSLFDDDFDDGDDLFSTAPVSKPKSPEKLPNKAPSKKPTSEKSVSQDSLFGGPTSKTRKSSDPDPFSKDGVPGVSVETKPKERDKVEEDKPKAPKKVSLFDGDDDDDESGASGLFVSPAKISEDGDKLNEPLVKVRSRSLFDDEDVLFGGPQEEDPSVDLFKTDDVGDSSKKEPASKKRSESKASRLDELFEDAEDDDLFSSKSKDSKILGKPPIPTPRKASLPKEEPKPSVNEDQSLEGEKEKARIPSISKSIQDEPDTPSPKKKPVGGVSLFGGLDPFGSKVSRSRSSSEIVEAPSKGSPKKDLGLKKPSPPISPVISDSIVMQRPSLKDTKELSVSFDDPAEVNTLHSANKERAKIQVKRRPSSRKGRQDALRKSAVFVDDDTDSKASLEEASSSSFTSSPLTPEGGDGFTDGRRRTDPPDSISVGTGKECSVMSPSTEEEDMFAIGDHVGLMTHVPDRTKSRKLNEDDLFANDVTSKTNSSDESANMFGADEGKRDTQLGNVLNFGDKKAKDKKVTNSKPSTATSKSKVLTNDIFEDGSSNEEDLFSSSDNKKKSLLPSNSKHNEDNDLFSSASKSSVKMRDVDLFADDDDLFSVNSAKAKNKSSKPEAKSLFEDEPKDDIFANLKTTKKTASSASSTSKNNSSVHNDSKKNAGKSIFDDDDDDDTVDLFNDPLLVKKK